MQSFDLNQMAALAGIGYAKAKNWTVGRPFTIRASAYQASGRGSMNLYTIEDVYLMALAQEFSGLGFAAVAIGKLVEAVQAKFPKLAEVPRLTVWRPKAAGVFKVAEGQEKPTEMYLWVTVNVRELVQRVDTKAKKLTASAK